MSAKSETWKARPQQVPPEQFWTDFSKFVLASYNHDKFSDDADHDHYWDTLIKWGNVLMDRYKSEMVVRLVIGYINMQSDVATGGKGQKLLEKISNNNQRQ